MDTASLQFLQISLSRIDPLIRSAVARAQAAGYDPTDALRGLIVSDAEVDMHLTQPALGGLWTADDADFRSELSLSPDAGDVPFLFLVQSFGLTALDANILLLALAPELDRRYERLYGYLQDDVSLRRPTVNLMMNLLGTDVAGRFAVWERLLPEQPLRKHSLVHCLPDPNRHQTTFLAHHIKVDHRLVAFLLGDGTPDERLKDAVEFVMDGARICVSDSVIAPVREMFPDSPIVYLRGTPGTGRRETAAALCAEYQLPLLSVDLARLSALEIPLEQSWRLAIREAYLAGAALMVRGWESCLSEEGLPPQDLWDSILAYPRPVFLCGAVEWEPLDVRRERRMLRVQFPVPSYEERRHAWHELAQAAGIRVQRERLDELASKFRFTRAQVARAFQTAADLALSRGEAVSVADLYAGAQAHAGLRLGRLAERILPRFDWDDLILPPDRLEQLQEITARARYAHIVKEQWGFGAKIALPGVSALFAGESGTGKTMAAEVIAKSLGLVLYKIDLSSVVSKYIGETEKNLAVIFDEAQASNAILFFDEADALFGKRSEVKDARDRYANIEIAYLLQKIESYDGVAIMATNLRQNLDEAFTRRLDFLVDFPFPDPEYRALIWQAHFPPQAPLAADVNMKDIGEAYRLAGGNIRNAAVASAYLAAADGGVITLQHIRSAVRREHQKMGRLIEDY